MIRRVNYNQFFSHLPKEWKEIFIEEYNKYGNDFKLFGFYENKNYLGGFCVGFNPDYFDEEEGKNIIDNILSNNYIKVSYFSVLDKYKGNKIGEKYLSNFLKKSNDGYFLTCDGDKLKEYYISLGFKLINHNKGKHILIFN